VTFGAGVTGEEVVGVGTAGGVSTAKTDVKSKEKRRKKNLLYSLDSFMEKPVLDHFLLCLKYYLSFFFFARESFFLFVILFPLKKEGETLC
jgi:hypothetical protein